ncbi:hypothetical protein RJ640_018200 [Escallonia rubra]|uniref:Uncharacterized protein n=1 Tax=Escallonia rubra TaxID=112253 RepID=A0AA88R1S2_9ASTE|nr:hypothetical protein RJ640_018200 [Escallonia rubra]
MPLLEEFTVPAAPILKSKCHYPAYRYAYLRLGTIIAYLQRLLAITWLNNDHDRDQYQDGFHLYMEKVKLYHDSPECRNVLPYGQLRPSGELLEFVFNNPHKAKLQNLTKDSKCDAYSITFHRDTVEVVRAADEVQPGRRWEGWLAIYSRKSSWDDAAGSKWEG